MESRGFVKSQGDPFKWYREEIVLIFYVDDLLIFFPYKYKIDDISISLQVDFKIEDYVDPRKYIGTELDRHHYGSINLRRPYITQSIINMIPGMDK